jgi:hypothetical protein
MVGLTRGLKSFTFLGVCDVGGIAGCILFL